MWMIEVYNIMYVHDHVPSPLLASYVYNLKVKSTTRK